MRHLGLDMLPKTATRRTRLWKGAWQDRLGLTSRLPSHKQGGASFQLVTPQQGSKVTSKMLAPRSLLYCRSHKQCGRSFQLATELQSTTVTSKDACATHRRGTVQHWIWGSRPRSFEFEIGFLPRRVLKAQSPILPLTFYLLFYRHQRRLARSAR